MTDGQSTEHEMDVPAIQQSGNDVSTGAGISPALRAEALAKQQGPFIPCQVDGSPIAATLRGFGHGWQGQHNETNAVVQRIFGMDEYNRQLIDEMHHTLRSNGAVSTGVLEASCEADMADETEPLHGTHLRVRRLTPVECERLMGWPDDWTSTGDDGRRIADTHRYRMCGNGVVSPVAEWIGRRLAQVEHNENI